ncbi:MAG: hypothetical protein SGJ13_05500 [Actinomycetota bacterium]|nr:hypothetical protein [Actinomycetota bacterium]
MARPSRFEHNRYLGNKATMVFYDLDVLDQHPGAAAAVERLLETERFATFGPDTPAEARNRCYRPHPSVTY